MEIDRETCDYGRQERCWINVCRITRPGDKTWMFEEVTKEEKIILKSRRIFPSNFKAISYIRNFFGGVYRHTSTYFSPRYFIAAGEL